MRSTLERASYVMLGSALAAGCMHTAQVGSLPQVSSAAAETVYVDRDAHCHDPVVMTYRLSDEGIWAIKVRALDGCTVASAYLACYATQDSADWADTLRTGERQ